MNQFRSPKKIGRKRRAVGWTLFALGAAVALLWAISHGREFQARVWETRQSAVRLPWSLQPGAPLMFTPTVRWNVAVSHGVVYLIRWEDVPMPPPGAMAFPILEFRRLPLLPVISGLMLTAGGFLVAAMRAATVRADQCRACGYSIAGLMTNAVCPECGRRL